MKAQVDKHWSEREFAEGDLVYIKLQPHIQSSVAFRDNHKLSFKFYGPFRVLQRIGTVAYRIDLPQSAKIHPVLHVSQLKRHVPPSAQVSSDLDSVCTDPFQALVPTKVLAERLLPRGATTIKQLLIQWGDLPPEMATWEEEIGVKRRYPESSAWGQAETQGGGNVTNG